jgi:hypothetical protein
VHGRADRPVRWRIEGGTVTRDADWSADARGGVLDLDAELVADLRGRELYLSLTLPHEGDVDVVVIARVAR